MNRPQDITAAVKQNIQKDINTFNDEDKRSGYAAYMASWWNELPPEMTDEEAREYLGITNPSNI